MTNYVDLGLPSGTLWADDYEKKDGSILYSSYDEAVKKNIPTTEQIEELIDTCQWGYESITVDGQKKIVKAVCVGPNGNQIVFLWTGKMFISSSTGKEVIYDKEVLCFWAKDIKKKYMGIFFDYANKICHTIFNSEVSNECLSIRLVKAK